MLIHDNRQGPELIDRFGRNTVIDRKLSREVASELPLVHPLQRTRLQRRVAHENSLHMQEGSVSDLQPIGQSFSGDSIVMRDALGEGRDEVSENTKRAQQIADRVYKMMKRDLAIERDRRKW